MQFDVLWVKKSLWICRIPIIDFFLNNLSTAGRVSQIQELGILIPICIWYNRLLLFGPSLTTAFLYLDLQGKNLKPPWPRGIWCVYESEGESKWHYGQSWPGLLSGSMFHVHQFSNCRSQCFLFLFLFFFKKIFFKLI